MKSTAQTINLTMLAAMALAVVACGGGEALNPSTGSTTTPPSFPANAIYLPAENLTTAAVKALTNAKSGDTIVFPKGKHSITQTLSIDGLTNALENVSLRGYGRNETILTFPSTSSAEDGILASGMKNITIQDLSVYEAKKNGIKVTDSDGVILRNVGAVWEGTVKETSGAYGLYPVKSKNVLVEDSYSYGSADAGIYVGQSVDVVVRRNKAEYNVAGIEIENTVNADVYDNEASNNAGGMLVFDLPIGDGRYGKNVRVFGNNFSNNNTRNFAGSGVVGLVPPGTGVLILSSKDVAVYRNTVKNNKSLGFVISSYYLVNSTFGQSSGDQAILFDGYSPFAKNIQVYNNDASFNGYDPTAGNSSSIKDVFLGYVTYRGELPHFLYDGIGQQIANSGALAALGLGPYTSADKICAKNNGEISYGEIYNTAENFTAPSGSAKFLINKAGATKTLLECDPFNAPLTASTATINGVTYGCGADDATDPSAARCQLK